ncbi:MAG: peroxiredoxin-like family protein [Planctomycetota bacterium]
MSLQEQLSQQKAAVVEQLPADIVEVMVRNTQELLDSGIEERAPKVGDQLAAFELPNQDGHTVKLAELLQQGPVVVTFYRGGWCPYCNLELRAYQQALPQINASGATLVAITPELPDQSLSTKEKNELEFQVLTDKDATYARELGLVFTLPEELRPIYQNFGIDVEQHNGEGQFDLPLAATFVIGSDGNVAYAFATADYTQRAEPSEVVQILESLTSDVA